MAEQWRTSILAFLKRTRQLLGGERRDVLLKRYEEDGLGPAVHAASVWIRLPRNLAPGFVESVAKLEDNEQRDGKVEELLGHLVSDLLQLPLGRPPLTHVWSSSFDDLYAGGNELPPGAMLDVTLGATAPIHTKIEPVDIHDLHGLDAADLRARIDAIFEVAQKGRRGYVEVPQDWDPEWPIYAAATGQERLLEVVTTKLLLDPTLEELAQHLNASGFSSLDGKPFTKASVRRVVIASELLLGSDFPGASTGIPEK